MIKPSDLRLGNFVENEYDDIGEVIAIDNEYITIRIGGEWGDTERRYYESIIPIELTPELLEKCGFEKGIRRIDEHGLLKILPDGRYEIIECTDGETYRSYDNKIEYLHQLQNLFFALADEFEFTIKDETYDATKAAIQQVKALTWQPQKQTQPIGEAFAKEFSAVGEAISGFQVKAAKGEEGLLVEVLQEHLGRLVTSDDFKRCQMSFLVGKPDQYILSYGGVDLGLVKRIFGSFQQPHQFGENNFTISYTFEFHKKKP